MIYVSKVSEVPEGEHFAVFESDHVTIPGDERSRTNPGHGYPASDKYFIRYIAFESMDELKAWVEERELDSRYNSSKYRLVKVTPLLVEVKVSVDVK